MGEISDELIDQGILDYWLHRDRVCGQDCRYCSDIGHEAPLQPGELETDRG